MYFSIIAVTETIPEAIKMSSFSKIQKIERSTESTHDLQLNPQETQQIDLSEQGGNNVQLPCISSKNLKVLKGPDELNRRAEQRRLDKKKASKERAEQGKLEKEKTAKKRKNMLSWEDYFMGVALLSAQRSKDPSRQVKVI